MFGSLKDRQGLEISSDLRAQLSSEWLSKSRNGLCSLFLPPSSFLLLFPQFCATLRSFPAPLCCLKLLGQKGSLARAGLGRIGVVAVKTGTSSVLCFHGCAWKGRVGTRPPSPERRDVCGDDHSFCHAALRSGRLCVSPMEALCRSSCPRSCQ